MKNDHQKFMDKLGTLSILIVIFTILWLSFFGEDVKAEAICEYQGAEAIDIIRARMDVVTNALDFLKEEITIRQAYTRLNQEEYDILCRIAEAEATSGTIEQKRDVAWCVLNRMNDNEFPSTIEEVVFQKLNDRYQFSPIADNRYYEVVIMESTVFAVEEAMKNIGKHDGLWFMARSASETDKASWFDRALNPLFNDGIHEYFNRKE